MAPSKDMMLSSPDPLGMSNENTPSHSPTKAGRRLSIPPRPVLTEASPNAQVQEFYINAPPSPRYNASPVKSPKQTAQPTSPWRIRLTVQAEEVDETLQRNNSPVKRIAERTTTISVPLKGGDDTSPAMKKKGRGRPRKSLTNPVKRAGTPKPKAGGRRKTMLESPEKQDIDANGETVTPPKKPRGRPRKSMEPKTMEPSRNISQNNGLDVWLGSSFGGGEETNGKRSKTSRTRSRGRRQEISPIKIAVDSDGETQSNSKDIGGNVPKMLAWTLGNRDDEKDQVDQKISQSYETPTPQIEQSSALEISRGESVVGQEGDNEWQSMIHRGTRSPNPHGDDAVDQTDFDPTRQHQEDDSILESEGFSMVSVSSLPSVDNNSVGPLQQYGSLHEHTPTITSSRSISPAPKSAKIQSSPRQLEIPSDRTSKLAKAVRAGIALQGVLSPKDQSQKLDSPFQKSQEPSPFLIVEKPAPQRETVSCRVREHKVPEERLDNLFKGFGAGTRRELRAGLRLGEELAKRQRQTSQKSVVSSKEGDDVFQRTNNPTDPRLSASDRNEGFTLKIPEPEKQVRYPVLLNNQLPSPERSLVDEEEDRMSWKAETPIKQEEPALTNPQALMSNETIGLDASAIDYTMMARKEEWQREREAVSKQIEMANKSQVIVIGSDSGDEEEEAHTPEEDVADSDIWQAEAQSANQSVKSTPEASDMLLQPEVLKPRRSKLPSPWRRNSQIIYNDEMEPTQSDLFWQPDQLQAKASERRNAKKSQVQDHSNVSANSILDNSLENTRRAEAQIQLEASEAWPVGRSLLSDDEFSNTGTSAEEDLDHGSILHADRTTKSPVILSPSEKHTLLEAPPTPKDLLTKDATEVSERIKTLKVTESTSVERVLQTTEDRKIAIDPRLLRKKTQPSSASNRPSRPMQPLQPANSSDSWLSRLTAPIWSVFAPAASFQPAATKEDILCSSPHEPLCQLTPWEECHFRALGPLYYSSFLYGAHLFPFNPRSRSARYCGAYVTSKLGWSRKITPEDCGITDAFMVLLDERGFALGEPGARWIDEGMVIAMCVALWVGMVKRGEIEADLSKGQRIGLRDQGDRKWTKDDIDWASNESAYFERKRREFDGLPSWKNKA